MSVKYLTDVHDYHLARLVSLTLDPNDEWVKHDYTIGLDHLGRHTPIAYLHPEDQPKLADHIRSLCNMHVEALKKFGKAGYAARAKGDATYVWHPHADIATLKAFVDFQRGPGPFRFTDVEDAYYDLLLKDRANL